MVQRRILLFAQSGLKGIGSIRSTRKFHAATKVKVYKKKPGEFSDLTVEQRKTLASFLRVNQAGELAANSIYEGQIAVLGTDPETKEILTVGVRESKTMYFAQTLLGFVFSRPLCGFQE